MADAGGAPDRLIAEFEALIARLRDLGYPEDHEAIRWLRDDLDALRVLKLQPRDDE